MDKQITANNITYELIKNYRDAFNEEEFINKCTDYFTDYEYIVGDIAYNKLRLKGFYESNNKKAKKINNYNTLEEYLKNNCDVDCRYFILKNLNSKYITK